MHAPDDRRHVVLAMRFEPDIAHDDDLVVAVHFLEGALQQHLRILSVTAEPFLVGARHASGRAFEPFAHRIVAGPADQRAHRVFGLIA